jgi:hypothetical protein
MQFQRKNKIELMKRVHSLVGEGEGEEELFYKFGWPL